MRSISEGSTFGTGGRNRNGPATGGSVPLSFRSPPRSSGAQPVLRSELRAMGPLPAAVDEVLELFGRHRLLTFDRDPVSRGPTVELAHESLLHEWPRLAGWIRDAQADLSLRSRIATAATEWERGGQDPGELLAGRRLAEVEAWQGSTDLALSDLETRFIAASSRQASADLHARRRRRGDRCRFRRGLT